MKSKKKKLESILPIAIALFLLAASPLFMSTAANTQTASPNANGALVNHSTQLVAASGKVCPTGTHCTYVADGIGGVMVFNGNKIIATIPVKLTSSDPYTCPEDAYYWSGVGVLVSDPCGNTDAGELRVLNPATNSWGKSWTNAGGEPLFMTVAGGDLYVTNFFHQSVTVLSSSDKVVGTVTTCGQPTEFVDSNSSGFVYVGTQYGTDPKTGSTAGCVDLVKGTKVIATAWADRNGGPGANLDFSGVAVNQVTGNVYVNCYNCINKKGTYGEVIVYPSTLKKVVKTLQPPSGAEELWGMTYSPTTQSVYPIDSYTVVNGVFSSIGFTFAINATNSVGHALKLGPFPDYGCYNTGETSVNIPNISGGSSYGTSILSIVSATGKVTQVNYWGYVDGYGCTSN
jgi:hypothetical protein